MAYKLRNECIEDTINHLNHREKQGYVANTVMFHPEDSDLKPFSLNIYIGSPDNSDFAGPAPLETISNVIVNSEGPSGKNIDYFLNLVNYIKTNLPQDKDEHLFQLETLVIKQMKKCAT